MMNQLKAGAVLSFIALLVNSIVSLIYTPIMLRTLGQSEYGLYVLAMSVISYISILNFGLGNAVIRYVSKYRELKQEKVISSLYGMFFWLFGLLGILTLLAGIVLTANADSLFASSLHEAELHKLQMLMMILVVNIAVSTGFGMFSFIILAHERFIFQKIVVILSSLCSPIVSLPFLLHGYGSLAIVIITTVVNVIVICFNVYFCLLVLRIKFSFKKPDMSLVKEVIVFSSFIFLNLIIDKIFWSTDSIILGMHSGTVAISVYALGTAFTGYFSGFSYAISNVFLGRVSSMVAGNVSNNELSSLFIKIGRLQFIVLSFALSGFVVFGQEFIQLWVGNEYRESYVIALLITVPMIIALMQEMGNIILQAKNIQRFKSSLFLGVAILNVILSLLFVEKWGALGCAAATATAFTLGNIIIMNIYFWKRISLNMPRFWLNIIKMSFPLTLTITLGFIINPALPALSWGVFFIKIFVFSILFLLCMWFLGMNAYEKGLLTTSCNRLFTLVGLKRTSPHHAKTQSSER